MARELKSLGWALLHLLTVSVARGANRFQCDVGIGNWMKAWSDAQKEFCCSTQNVGCPDRLGSCKDYGCDLGFYPKRSCQCNDHCPQFGNCCHDFIDSCKAPRDVAVPKQPVPQPAPPQPVPAMPVIKRFDCAGGRENWEADWSKGKKIHCCVHHKVACDPFACDQGHRSSWSGEKKVYCCVHKRVGCQGSARDAASPGAPPPPPPPPRVPFGSHADGPPEASLHGPAAHLSLHDLYDCKVGLNDFELEWSDSKQAWCCKHQFLGCPRLKEAKTEVRLAVPPVEGARPEANETVRSSHYDCRAGFSNWEWGWSAGKKKWCCQYERRGCRSSQCESLTFAEWSPEKRSWCCRHAHKGCSPAETTSVQHAPVLKPFNCDATFQGSADWSEVKRRWCCANEGKGCQSSMTTNPVQAPPTRTSLAQPFDCQKGLGDRGLEGWSPAKRTWCCAHADKGPKGIDLSVRCSLAPGSPSRGSRHHEPRLTAAKVTTIVQYNCSEDYQNWKTGWSSTKKQYCCHEAGRACAEGSLPNKLLASTGAPTATSSSRLRNCSGCGNQPLRAGDDFSVKMATAPWSRWKRWFGGSTSSIAALTALALATGLSIALVLVGVSRWMKRPKPTSVLQRRVLEDLLRRSSGQSPEGKAAELTEPGLE